MTIVSHGSEGDAAHPGILIHSLSHRCSQVVAGAGILSEASSHLCLVLNVGQHLKLSLGLSAGTSAPGASMYTGCSHSLASGMKSKGGEGRETEREKGKKRPRWSYIASLLLFFLIIYLFIYFIYLFLPVLGLRCCTWAFARCSERGLLFVAMRGLLIAVASLVAEHGL